MRGRFISHGWTFASLSQREWQIEFHRFSHHRLRFRATTTIVPRIIAPINQTMGDAPPLDWPDNPIRVIAVGPVLSPTVQGESEVTFWRVTVFEVDDVRAQSQP